MKELAYLAAPYSHEDPAIRRERFEAVNRAAAKLALEGEHVYSPISCWHCVCEQTGLPWYKTGDPQDQEFESWLAACAKIYVLQLDGWLQSAGIRAELALAEEMSLEIIYLPPEFAAQG